MSAKDQQTDLLIPDALIIIECNEPAPPADDFRHEIEKGEFRSQLTRFIIFDQTSQPLYSTFKVDQPELIQFLSYHENEEATFQRGLTLDGNTYDVHRWHSGLIYGRYGVAGRGEGFCFIK
ncbi:MAG: hypothetical protein EZS28_040787, partial [Streblomastix strix]